MTAVKCARCPNEAGLIQDGPLSLRLCHSCREVWMRSSERRSMLMLVAHFLGEPEHPMPSDSLLRQPPSPVK